MNTALLRAPSHSLQFCRTTFIDSDPPDPVLAEEQHANLAEILRKCNYTVITLPPVPEHPDSVFLEDTALILPECSILLTMGTGSRKPESAMMRGPLYVHNGRLHTVSAPARIEGGDVLRIGRIIYVGQSSRTDAAGKKSLERIVAEWGYETIAVPVSGALHLKTAVTALDDTTVILNRDWLDAASFKDYRILEVDPEEPFAANVLRLRSGLVVHKGFEKTNSMLREAGYELIETDISEFLKAEAGLTCLCLLIEQ